MSVKILSVEQGEVFKKCNEMWRVNNGWQRNQFILHSKSITILYHRYRQLSLHPPPVVE